MRKNEIKTAALNLFAIKGYAQTSMQEIADEVKINKATIYIYFHSKKDLAVSILDDIITEFNEGLKNIVPQLLMEPIDILFFEIYKYVLAFFEDKQKLLFYKKMILLIAAEYDEELRIEARRLLNNKDNDLLEILEYVFDMKEIKLSAEDRKKFVFSYVNFIQGFLDWRIYSTDTRMDFIDISMKSNWLIFWYGCKSFFEFSSIEN